MVYHSKYKLMKYKLMVSQCIHIEYKSKNSWYHIVFKLNTKVEVYLTHDPVSQCIHIEYKSKNSWYHSVFTLNTNLKSHDLKSHDLKSHDLKSHVYMWKYKLMVSQCIHIEYKSKNSWNHCVFKLNTKVKTHGITVYSH
ncbi:hypothetical protein OUZ56_026113 [Daphnia magna]|uniref:Uncharacterized protein n=1 Tax=Daphnia magna TaxID=35525 RepID=A0ABQ9ZKW3_9CRUS|nr:hypothetical protein OUZ56_026113 [Daphnia magna]